VPAVTRRATDGARRTLPWWEGCARLGEGDAFLLMARAKASFDGRYFGVTRRRDIVGKAHLLWAC
jgi:type IV secretory pathway protease TraF